MYETSIRYQRKTIGFRGIKTTNPVGTSTDLTVDHAQTGKTFAMQGSLSCNLTFGK